MAHFLKFLVVGGIGFVINTVLLIFGVRGGLKPSIAGPLGAEVAIISNFILNNFWAFSDKQITDWSVLPWKFIQFNILALGSVAIQFICLRLGERIFGLKKFKEPIMDLPIFSKLQFVEKLIAALKLKKLTDKITAYLIFYVGSVGIGLVVNFVIYSTVIWK